VLCAGPRSRKRASSAALALLASCLLFFWAAASAPAATVTLGPNLTGLTSGTKYTCGIVAGCTFSQAGPGYVAPVSGVIVRWRVIGSTGPLTLRVLNGNTGGAVGPTGTAATDSLQEFPADVPIRAGEQVGLDIPKEGSSLAYLNLPGTSIGYWAGTLASGETRPPTSTTDGFQLLFNADVQPPPGISTLAPGGGPINAVNSVVISGHDLTGASAVRFGTTPAIGFNVNSDAQITASAPPSAAIASVPVSVTTVAGTATSQQSFRYEGCRVPKLRGKKVKAAKKQIRAAGCKVGKLTKRKGATAKKGKVAKQAPKPGTVAAPGTAVKLTIKR
jgi:large repetitive protein